MIRFISALLFALTLCAAQAQTTVAWLTNATGLASLPPTSSRQAVSVGNESSGWSQWNWNAASTASTNSTIVAYTGLATGRWIQSPINGVAIGLTTPTAPTVGNSVVNLTALNAAIAGVSSGGDKLDKTNGVASGLTSATLSSLYPNSVTRRAYFDTPGSTNINSWMAIQTWGDSLTEGAGITATTNKYPTQLATYTGFRVSNGGVGGETSTQIRTRQTAGSNTWFQSTIIWAGRNNYTSSNTVKSDITAMVANQAKVGNTNRFIVLSILNATNEYRGTANYAIITNLNADLATTYGQNAVDIRSYLVSRYNSANAQDVIDYSNDVVPSSLRSDSIHLNDAGYAAVAAYLTTNSLPTLRGSWSSVATPAAVAAILRQPGPIGSEVANTGAFSALSATSAAANTVTSGTIYNTNFITTYIQRYVNGGLGPKSVYLNGDGQSLVFDANLTGVSDNTYDIGNSATVNRFRNAYFGGYVQAPTVAGGSVIATNGVSGATVTASGAVSGATASITGAASMGTARLVNGANSKDITLAGDGVSFLFGGNILASADYTYSLGYPSSYRFYNAYFGGAVVGNSGSFSSTTVGTQTTTNFIYSPIFRVGTPAAFKSIVLSGDASSIQFEGNVIPYTDATYDLGFSTSQYRFRNLYLSGAISAPSETVGSLIVTNASTLNTVAAVSETVGSIVVTNAATVGSLTTTGAIAAVSETVGSLVVTNAITAGSVAAASETVGSITVTNVASVGTLRLVNGANTKDISLAGDGVSLFHGGNVIASADATYDLGLSATQYRFRHAYLSGALQSSSGAFSSATVGTETVTNFIYSPIYRVGTPTTSKQITLSGDASSMQFDGHIIGAADGTINIGFSSTQLRPNNIWAKSLIQGSTFESTVATGTPPMVVASTTLVSGLNADRLDGLHKGGIQPANANLTNVAALTVQSLPSTIISVTENTQTGTTYTVLSTDNGKVVTLNNASAITVTVPTLSAGFTCTFIQKGAGQVTFSASGTTISNAHSQTKTFGQYATVTLYGLSSTAFVLSGDTGT